MGAWAAGLARAELSVVQPVAVSTTGAAFAALQSCRSLSQAIAGLRLDEVQFGLKSHLKLLD